MTSRAIEEAVATRYVPHRGGQATARDRFDFALVIEREPRQLLAATPFLPRHGKAFLARIRQPHPGWRAASTPSPRWMTNQASITAWRW